MPRISLLCLLAAIPACVAGANATASHTRSAARRSLDLPCAITRSTGNAKRCAWVFAGSYMLASATVARVVTSKKFRCDFTMHGTISQLRQPRRLAAVMG